jgi:hypothetical protein
VGFGGPRQRGAMEEELGGGADWHAASLVLPDISATMAWHRDRSVQAGLHALVRMSRHISPVCSLCSFPMWTHHRVHTSQEASSEQRCVDARWAVPSSECWGGKSWCGT